MGKMSKIIWTQFFILLPMRRAFSPPTIATLLIILITSSLKRWNKHLRTGQFKRRRLILSEHKDLSVSIIRICKRV